METITKSARETQKLGKEFAGKVEKGKVIALEGNLGSGKTTFVQGLASGLGIRGRIISPTFILMRRYKVEKNNKIGYFYHVDLYRLEDQIKRELDNLGVNKLWEDEKNLIVIEWAEKAKDIIPKNTVWIKFENLGKDRRKITFKK